MHRAAATVTPEYLTRQYRSARRSIAAVFFGICVAACSLNSTPKPAAGADALSDEDRQRDYAAQIQALEAGPSGAAVAWSNPDSGRYGNVVPGPAYVTNGVTCRQYTDTRYIDGNAQTERGTSCRNAEGTWTVAK
jgi:surface antigen